MKLKNMLSKMTDLPVSSFGERPYIEMESDLSFKLDGCREILSYDCDGASFLTDESVIKISGSSLEIRSYGNSTVRVTGQINALSIERTKNADKNS